MYGAYERLERRVEAAHRRPARRAQPRLLAHAPARQRPDDRGAEARGAAGRASDRAPPSGDRPHLPVPRRSRRIDRRHAVRRRPRPDRRAQRARRPPRPDLRAPLAAARADRLGQPLPDAPRHRRTTRTRSAASCAAAPCSAKSRSASPPARRRARQRPAPLQLSSRVWPTRTALRRAPLRRQLPDAERPRQVPSVRRPAGGGARLADRGDRPRPAALVRLARQRASRCSTCSRASRCRSSCRCRSRRR